MRNRLLQKIDDYSVALEGASVWDSSGEVFGHVASARKTDYVYEFYCYIRIICDLMTNYEVEYNPGSGRYRNKFPKKGVNKAGRPMFYLKKRNSDNREFQVCAGTKVRTRFNAENLHPDISFQKPDASDDPDWRDLFMIFDAKFREHSDKIPNSVVREFCEIVNMYDIAQTAANTNIQFNEFTQFVGNCLLTNGLAHNDNDQYIRVRQIKEIERFDVGSVFRIRG